MLLYMKICDIQMNEKTHCVNSRHFSGIINPQVIEKINPRTKKRIKTIKLKCDICGKNKSQIFTM